MAVNPLSLHHNYISAARLQINALINSDASIVLEDTVDAFFIRTLPYPKIILSSEPTSLDRFQVKDTSRAVLLTFPKTIYIIHCLWPESRDLYKEQTDRQRENRWCFISRRERESW